jgi:hypothetical protein
MIPNKTVSVSLLGQDTAAVNTTYPSGFRVHLRRNEGFAKMLLDFEIKVPDFVRLNATFSEYTVEETLGDKVQGNTYRFNYTLYPGLARTCFYFDYITLDWEDPEVGGYSFPVVIQVRNKEGEIIASNLTAHWTIWRNSTG